MHNVHTIISGGQTGVDMIGLVVGKYLKLETGGTAPPDFFTESGVNIYLRQYYGLTEISKELQKGMTGKQFYLPRTEQNVINSDGTVYYTTTPHEYTGGLKTTIDYCTKHEMPFIINPKPDELRQWLIDKGIHVLNVAGNRASKLTVKQMTNIKELLIQALKQ